MRLPEYWRPPSREEWARKLPGWWPSRDRRCISLQEALEKLPDAGKAVEYGVYCRDGWCLKYDGFTVCLYPWPRVFRLG